MSRIQLVPSSLRFFKFHNGFYTQSLFSGKEESIFTQKYSSLLIQYRWKTSTGDQNSIVPKVKGRAQITIAEKVKQTSKDAGYLSIIIAGIGVTGVIFYAILRELFSRQSPNSIYSDALNLCRTNSSVIDALGEPIKGYGELSSRGRRRHVSHFDYEKDGKNYMRLKFYLKGIRGSGTVHLEMIEGEKKKYEYRYLFVDVEDYPSRTIILKDNRNADAYLGNGVESK